MYLCVHSCLSGSPIEKNLKIRDALVAVNLNHITCSISFSAND